MLVKKKVQLVHRPQIVNVGHALQESSNQLLEMELV